MDKKEEEGKEIGQGQGEEQHQEKGREKEDNNDAAGSNEGIVKEGKEQAKDPPVPGEPSVVPVCASPSDSSCSLPIVPCSTSPCSEDILSRKKEQFMCGVVEGFYGRPWTTEQRKDLFGKMQEWGMTSYLYAPKDDCKHRAYWRELYTVEEAEHLQSLISLAAECNIDFYYAISPGLDITYSNAKEISCLKRKLDQVSQLGCKCFALLFDDIEPEMCKQDKEVFQSFAHAQVTLTNDVYQHLNSPKFLFCPTQYCTARAFPSVRNSEYLNTIGSKLVPEIDIMWTGDKVITKVITEKSLEDINEVLRRPVVIWDNEHANDYDQKRVFLGPYSGRSPEIISKLNGVMTNPNCEYGANFVAIHTLAQWSKCKIDGTQPYSNANEAVTADIRLEQIQDNEVCEPAPFPPDVYHPRNALLKAIKSWIPEFSKQKTVWGPMVKPQVGLAATPAALVPSVTTCLVNTNTTANVVQTSLAVSTTAGITATGVVQHATLPLSVNGIQITAPIAVPVVPPPASPEVPSPPNPPTPVVATEPSQSQAQSVIQPISVPVMNSLVSTNKVIVDPTLLNPAQSTTAVSSEPAQPLSTNMAPPKLPMTVDDDAPMQAANNIPQVTDNVVPGPTYFEPMEEDLVVTSTTAAATSTNKSLVDIPMESLTNPPTPASGGGMMQDECTSNLQKAESSTMLCETQTVSNNPEVTTMLCDDQVCTDPNAKFQSSEMTTRDLLLISNLFYLPSEHGQIGLDLLNDFFWLKRNANTMLPPGSVGSGTSEDRQEWENRAAKLKQNVSEVQKLFVKLCSCQNRELVYDLYSYLWDMCGVVQTLEGFVMWLSKGCCSPKSQNYVVGQQTWFSGIREAFSSGDHEPWMFRGGLVSDLQRLLPLDSGNDLYHYKFPDVPASLLYYVRPFQPKDEEAIYALAANAYEESIDAPMGLCAADRELIGDKTVGGWLTLCPEYAFVCENSLDGSIVGYAVSAPEAKTFYTRFNMAWLPEMRLKYKKKTRHPSSAADGEELMLTPIEQMAQSFHLPSGEPQLPECCVTQNADSMQPQQPWGVGQMHVSSQVNELSLPKRLTMLMLACLRASGTIRAFVDLGSSCLDVTKEKEFYAGLGFQPQQLGEQQLSAEEQSKQANFLMRNF